MTLGPGETQEFFASAVLTEGITTNVVTVTGDLDTTECFAQESATVTVNPPDPFFECSKPIDCLTMIWDVDFAIRIKAWKGNPGGTLLAEIDDITLGEEVQVCGFSGAPNDVFWEVFVGGTTGTDGFIANSVFHLSCSDDNMDGPEDCGKSIGAGKMDPSLFIDRWLFEGMVDSGEDFKCNP